jgi:hypothetical protein
LFAFIIINRQYTYIKYFREGEGYNPLTTLDTPLADTKVKTILFCARNNLPLRGHRETGYLSLDSVRSSCIGGENGFLRALFFSGRQW